MVKCNEVMWGGSIGEPTHICEAEYGTEHTHGELMDYMRPVTPEDRFTPIDDFGNAFLLEV